ncbi:MAG: hypothetical protein VB934_07610, partial [Polyangiaceae bacterium]
SIFVVIALLLIGVVAPTTPWLANVAVNNLFGVLTTLLLAWHYTGQAWGMVASFAFMGGVRMDNTERLLIRAGLQILLVWHVLWGVKQMFGPVDWDPTKRRMPWVEVIHGFLPEVIPLAHQAYDVWSIIVVLSVPVGIYGFVRIYRRTGRPLPVRSVVPWAATYMWYLLVWAHPGLFLLLQIFHAVQYLAFPMRVEMNQFVERHPEKQDRKIRHPEVRRALFAHLTPGTAKGPT